ncbi:MAG TPA: SgcJ/EcaC family oxidoreductase [Pirellulales bacterium]|nr:SgcJ/EcaC family oxidoreductase [Pirellulales bacterium]
MAQKPAPKGRAAAPAADPKRSPERAHEQDEKAIRQVADAFAKAYNAHDAKAIGNLFTADAETMDDEGKTAKGREAIERVFFDVFQDSPESQISIAIDSIQFVSPTVAVEDGVATVIAQAGQAGEQTRYTVVHAKQDGKWLMASARDRAEEPSSGEEQLKQLEWLVGEWIDESPDALIVTSSHWTDNHRYILSEFTIQVGGRPLLNGSQRIGWDPLAKLIRSWVFDSEGGFGEGTYTRSGNQWFVKMTGVTRDGRLASATNIITNLGKDRMTWQSRDRTVGGEAVPDVEEVLVVRKPPKPM